MRVSRKTATAGIRVAGYHADKRESTRLMVEGRVRVGLASELYREGVRARAAGALCSCSACKGGAA